MRVNGKLFTGTPDDILGGPPPSAEMVLDQMIAVGAAMIALHEHEHEQIGLALTEVVFASARALTAFLVARSDDTVRAKMHAAYHMLVKEARDNQAELNDIALARSEAFLDDQPSPGCPFERGSLPL